MLYLSAIKKQHVSNVLSKCDQEMTCEQCRLQVRPRNNIETTLRRHWSPTINCQSDFWSNIPVKPIWERPKCGFDQHMLCMDRVNVKTYCLQTVYKGTEKKSGQCCIYQILHNIIFLCLQNTHQLSKPKKYYLKSRI